MPINPHADEVRATAWADQFSTEVRERSQQLIEEALHSQGLCSDDFDLNLVILLDSALQVGAVAMALLLEEKGRLKEVDD